MNDDNKFRKVLLITVGTGREVSHGIYSSIDSNNPDCVYFIVSKASKEKTLNPLLEKIKNNKPEIIIEIIENGEINDIQILYRSYSKIIQELLNKGFLKKNISVDFTSGTKAMSAALVSAALSFEVNKLSYIYGDRDSDGRVKSGSERIISLSPLAIFTVSKLNKFIELFNIYQFESALNIFENEANHPDYNEVVNTLINIAEMYSAWDKFDFNSSFNFYKKIKIKNTKELQLKGKITNDGKILNDLKEDELDYSKVIDLFANAKRRNDEGKYDDGMARLYRLLEMIAQIEFEKTFGCSTSNVLLDKIPNKYHEKLKISYCDPQDKKYKIPLAYTFYILGDCGNEIGKIFKANETEIKKLLGLRNRSILAHGSNPISKSGFEKMLNLIKTKFISILPISDMKKDFQFPQIKKRF